MLAERKTESIGFPMTMSTSLSSPNGMLKVTADRGRLHKTMEARVSRWEVTDKDGKAQTTEADVRRLKMCYCNINVTCTIEIT